jgi:hypothetical protein
MPGTSLRITAAGTAPDLHRIPILRLFPNGEIVTITVSKGKEIFLLNGNKERKQLHVFFNCQEKNDDRKEQPEFSGK